MAPQLPIHDYAHRDEPARPPQPRPQFDLLFGDGHIGFLQQTMPLADLKALATKAGGETVSADY